VVALDDLLDHERDVGFFEDLALGGRCTENFIEPEGSLLLFLVLARRINSKGC
jgi:hypothetical protein